VSTRRGLPFRRDIPLFLLGAIGIGYQQVTERYYLPLMVLYGLMVGVPGLAQLILALRGLAAPDEDPDSGTTSMPSSSGPLPQSQSSTSSP